MSSAAGDVGTLLALPVEASSPTRALWVLGPGAGAPMRHVFLEDLCERLAASGIATLRYQFPYQEAGRRRPDARPRLIETVSAALAEGARVAASEGFALFAGGKSMGGRMTSLCVSDRAARAPDALRGIAFLGFPLHPSGKPEAASERAAHLEEVARPMLFLQGTRDGLAELELLRPVVAKLGTRATLHVVEGGDHSFKVLKRSGRTQAEVADELVQATLTWMGAVLAGD